MDGFNILTDPIFSPRTVGEWMGPRRLRPTPCKLSDLPKVDIVIISHNHYDHLDIEVVKQLKDSVTWYVPMGLGKWFAKLGVTNVVELDWWEEVLYEGRLKIVGTPIQHWSGRHVFDTNASLWCSFLVKGPTSSFFHCGDTGYCSVFKEIGRRYGPVTLAALPIGSYEPRWYMKHQHVDPQEAVQIHIDLAAQHSIGVHWGTFMMSDEHYLDPPFALDLARRERGLAPSEVFVTKLGATIVIPSTASSPSASPSEIIITATATEPQYWLPDPRYWVPNENEETEEADLEDLAQRRPGQKKSHGPCEKTVDIVVHPQRTPTLLPRIS
ncbi:hypothetical protein HK102_012461 [Quaeritorhiza haematococci]|nr:hypothetical protein HK102_012461 [Quaeritorhiza haematococci]